MLTYAIGKRLLAASIAWMGAAILPLCSLWLQYGRMAVQDIVLTCLELLGIWALLQAETSDRRRLFWGMVAGTTVGLGFLIKSIMIVLPIVALSPYLLHHHRHFRNPGLYLGVVIGFLPVSLWLWLSYQRYGLMPFQQLFGHLFMLGSKQFHADAGLLYYFWNIPLNAFPWALLALVGIGVVGYQLLVSHPSSLVIGHWLLGVQKIKDNRQITNHEGQTLPRISLLLYPLILFAALTVFSTRTPYYALQLYPFVGLFAAVALVWLANQAKSGITLVVSYGVGGLAIVLLIMGLLAIAGMIPIPVEFRVYGVLLCILGGGWLLLPWLWQRKQLRQWLAIWLLAPWLTLAVAGVVGLWGNYNPDVKATLASAQLSSVLQHHAVSVVVHDLQPEEHKTWVLLSFYTPQLGRSLPSLSALPVGSYAWVSPRVAIEPAEGYQVVASLRNWRLVLCKLNLPGNQPPGS
jgi:4-amino-4-deoxy-L-arabinose transferase-like glycosyltransferase